MASNQPDLTSVDWSQIPAPEDDGAADHLVDLRLPSVVLEATSGDPVDLAAVRGLSVVYAYPMTGQPGVALPDGWDMIPGARGCTPQSCVFRDHAGALRDLGVAHIFGLSTQDSAWQREATERLHLPFPLLSDAAGSFHRAVGLPTFRVNKTALLKRLTMILRDGVVTHVIYPIFPPDQNAAQVIDYLASTQA